MKVLLRQVFINDASSPFFNSRKDILIFDGKINKISDHITDKADTEIDGTSLHASPGFIDCFSNFNDPGFEFRETIETGAAAALAGGFTTVMVLPNTQPAIDSKSMVEYVVGKSARTGINILPIGAITKNTDGKELAEMYDMHASGARVFSDGLNCVQSAGLLLKALLYVKTFNGVLIQLPEDKTIAPQGLVNEGIVSTRLGLPGKSVMAEELIVTRDIELAAYANSRIHFTGISSPKSIAHITEAKSRGIQVTCSVTPYHLFFCDEDLFDYDTNLKVNPPLRTRDDMMFLRQAVLDGKVDCISTHHLPHHNDHKVVEFEYAKNGMIGLETTYAVLRTVLPELSEERLVSLLSTELARIFGLSLPGIAEGEPANITLHNPAESFTFSANMIKSASRNSPFIGRTLRGRVKAVIHSNTLIQNIN
jgi:dihydroorotase